MTIIYEFKGIYNSSSDKSYLRQSIRKLALQIGFQNQDLDDISLVLTEIFTNIDKYGGRRAEILASPIVEDNRPVGIYITVSDNGPGIDNIELAKRNGYTTSNSGSLGLGLGAIERLMDKVEIVSRPFKIHGKNSGTTVNVSKLIANSKHSHYDRSNFRHQIKLIQAQERNNGGGDYRQRFVHRNRKLLTMKSFNWEIDALSIQKNGQRVNGDAYVWLDESDIITAALIDGLGHGEIANNASMQVVRLIKEHSHLPLNDLINLIHSNLNSTIGVQIMLLRVDKRNNKLHYIGIGNIRAFIITGKIGKSFLSLSGTLGKRLPLINQSTLNIFETSVIILHTDGISRSWLPSIRRIEFTQHSVQEVKTWIMENYKKKDDDDSTILVIKNS